MQLIKQNIIKAILGIVVSLVVGAGAFFVSSGTSPLTNIRKLYDSSISEFEEERSSQRSKESLIEKPTTLPQSPTPDPSNDTNPSPIPSPSVSTTTTPRPILSPRPTLAPTPSSTQRVMVSPKPSPVIIR